MSDTSLMPQESLLGGGLNLNASAVDQNLRSIRQVEQSWRLPQLPDEVRLDLAANGAITPTNLASFLYGLDRDVYAENAEDRQPAVQSLVPAQPLRVVNEAVPFTPLTQTAFEQASSLVASLRGRKPQGVLDANAVQRWKLQAIERGKLPAPENGMVDGSWSPELTGIQREMALDDLDQAYRGNRTGAMPIGGENGVMKLLNDWTSPTGLMRAASELDLFWDFGQISDEWGSWGDKWRKVGDSKNPLDFGRNLVDAMTGPIDDFVVPILNVALLASGVGAGVNFARIGYMGARGVQAAEAFRGVSALYRVPKLGAIVTKAFPSMGAEGAAAKAFGELANASLLSSKLQKGGTTAQAIGGAMARWRALPEVVQARQLTQTGMRLGFVSQVEDLLPNYEGSGSLADVPGVRDAIDGALGSGRGQLGSFGFEMLFTPYTMFASGTFVAGGRQLIGGTARAIGSNTGRAFIGGVAGAGVGVLMGEDTGDMLTGAAVGGAGLSLAPAFGKTAADLTAGRPVLSKLIGRPGELLSKLSFKPLTQTEKLTASFYQAVRNGLDGDELSAFEADANTNGVLSALRTKIGAKDDEETGAYMGWMLLNASIDRTATYQASLVHQKGTDAFELARLRFRNQLHAQIRRFDGNASKEEVVWRIISKETSSQRGARRRFDNAMGIRVEGADFDEALAKQWDDADLLEVMATHDAQAAEITRTLMSPENLSMPEVMEYITSQVGSIGRWDDYTSSTTELRSMVAGGLFEEARMAEATTPFGDRMSILKFMDEFQEPFDDSKVDWAQHVHDTLFVDHGVSWEKWRSQNYYNPLARELNPSRSRLTLARAETVTKQNLIQAAADLKTVLDTHKAWRKASRVLAGNGKQFVTDGKDMLDDAGNVVVPGRKIGTMNDTELNEYLMALGLRSKRTVPAGTMGAGDWIGRMRAGIQNAAETLGVPTLSKAQRDSVKDLTDYIGAGARNGDVLPEVADTDPVLRQILWANDGDVDAALPEILREIFGADTVTDDAVSAVRAKLGKLPVRPERATYVDGVGAAELRHLNRLARHHGLEVDTAFDVTLRTYADELDKDPIWSTLYGLDPTLRKVGKNGEDVQTLSGLEALEERIKMLQTRANRTAADVDVDDLIAKLRAAGKTDEAQRLEDYVQISGERGYKVVYGKDFLHPDEVLHDTGLFDDVKARQLNALSLGNFFGRTHPIELAAKIQRYRAASVARELGRALGRDVDPDDPKVVQAMADLQRWVLDPMMASHDRVVDEMAHGTLMKNMASRVREMDAPKALQDLGLGKHQKKVLGTLKELGYEDAEALAIWKGVKASRFADWTDQGAFAIEAKLRRNNQALGALRFLAGTSEGDRLRKARTLGAASGGAYAGAIVAQNHFAEDDTGVGEMRLLKAGGLLAGGLLGVGASRVVGSAVSKYALPAAESSAGWARYGAIADNLAAFRDKMRFSMSPFFDLSRYTEAFVLNQIAGPMRNADGKRVGIPFNASPKKLRAAIGEVEFTKYRTELRNASKGVFDPDHLDPVGRWFEEVGILGFNPTNWMTSSFYHMRQNGMGPEEAFDAVQKMYHYGTGMRSGMEQTVNFIFFPFSFQKKTLTHAAQFLSDDMMRSVLLHDAYAAYEHLSERYDLDAWVENHLPVLEKLKQLNMFAYGISPGRLGGVNAPLIDFMVGDGPMARDEYKQGLILNLFSPQFVFVNPDGEMVADGGQSKSQLEQLVRRSIPVINDLHYMLEDTGDTVAGLTSPSMQTRKADAKAGYSEWAEFKVGVESALEQVGATVQDMYRDPGLAELRDMYMRKRYELEAQYPGWVESKVAARGRSAELGQERTSRISAVMFNPAEATPGDVAFYEFEQQLGNLESQKRGEGVPGLRQVLAGQGITDEMDWPTEYLNRIRGVAVEMVNRTPEFEMIYNKFYKSQFGDIVFVSR